MRQEGRHRGMGSNSAATEAGRDGLVPHPVRRAVTAVALGVALGALGALARPRAAAEECPPASGG